MLPLVNPFPGLWNELVSFILSVSSWKRKYVDGIKGGLVRPIVCIRPKIASSFPTYDRFRLFVCCLLERKWSNCLSIEPFSTYEIRQSFCCVPRGPRFVFSKQKWLLWHARDRGRWIWKFVSQSNHEILSFNTNGKFILTIYAVVSGLMYER